MNSQKFKVEEKKATFNYKDTLVSLFDGENHFVQVEYHGMKIKFLGAVEALFPFVDELLKQSFWLLINPIRSKNPAFQMDSLSMISYSMTMKNNMKNQLVQMEKFLNSPLIENVSRVETLKLVRTNFAKKMKKLKMDRQHADRVYSVECAVDKD